LLILAPNGAHSMMSSVQSALVQGLQ